MVFISVRDEAKVAEAVSDHPTIKTKRVEQTETNEVDILEKETQMLVTSRHVNDTHKTKQGLLRKNEGK